MLRGIHSSEEDNSLFKQGIPTFETVELCMQFIKKLHGSNPMDYSLRHSITHLTDWEQVQTYLIPRINVPKNMITIEMVENRFHKKKCINQQISKRLKLSFYKHLDEKSTLNTLNYLFFHMRCGIYISIRKNKVYTFAPFCNSKYTNNWPEDFKIETRLRPESSQREKLVSYYENKRRHYRRENILHFRQWWANGNIICNEHTAPGQITQWWGDGLVTTYKHMLETLCKERKIPDCDFFFNKRDFPQLKSNNTEPYDFIYDQQDVPLNREKYDTHLPILSCYTSPLFADIPSPTTEDWENAVNEIFLPSCIPNIYYGPRRTAMSILNKPRELRIFKEIPWEGKQNIVFFRGSATGAGITPETNQRLKVAEMNIPFLDAGITGFNKRDKKRTGHPMTFLQHSKLTKVNYVPMEQQGMYKYLLYIEGHSASNRYGSLMRTKSLILKVESTCEASELWFFSLLKPYMQQKNITKGLSGPDHIIIKSDLSNLQEQIEWCQTHDKECKIIAQNAHCKYTQYLSKEAILDYMQLVLVEITKKIK